MVKTKCQISVVLFPKIRDNHTYGVYFTYGNTPFQNTDHLKNQKLASLKLQKTHPDNNPMNLLISQIFLWHDPPAGHPAEIALLLKGWLL